jgi:hypothetical protein
MSCHRDSIMGLTARMPLMDMPRYLDYLERRLVAAGGEIEQRRVRTLAEASEAAPVVMNCSGLGAGELARDPAGASGVRPACDDDQSWPG